MSAQEQAALDKMVFRKTNAHTGRRISVSPDNSSMRHLAYGRILLNSAKPAESFSTGSRETGLICLSGQAAVTVDQNDYAIGPFDSIYIPRDSSVIVQTTSSADIAEISSDVSTRYPLKLVRYEELAKDPTQKFTTGTPGCMRHLNMLLVKNIEAGRLIAGITQADPGNWTSWPPHEHAAMLEEIYVYFDMPDPSFGIQLVYSNPNDPEVVTLVRDGDAVLIPKGYHPNVSVPGHRISFLWAMAAHREVEDRQFGVFNVQPGFAPAAIAPVAGSKT